VNKGEFLFYTINMSLTTQKKAQLRDFYYDTLGGGKIGKVWPRVQREFPVFTPRKLEIYGRLT